MKSKFIIIALFLLLTLEGCYYDVDPPFITVSAKTEKSDILFIAKEFKYIGSDLDTKKKMWELISGEAVVYKDNKIDLKDIEIKFLDKKGEVISTLKGDSGMLERNKNSASIQGNVILKNYKKGVTIYSTKLIWDGNKREIYNTLDDKTTIVSEGVTLRGSGLRTTPDVYPLELKNVEAVIQ
ncbi:MAG: LPS export ABC transporter periplasmic protein LptC [Brevinematia bacterium]